MSETPVDVLAEHYCGESSTAGILARAYLAQAEQLRELQETNRRLNRRAQMAEGVADENVEKCRRAGISLGRGLANYAATRSEETIATQAEQLRELREAAASYV